MNPKIRNLKIRNPNKRLPNPSIIYYSCKITFSDDKTITKLIVFISSRIAEGKKTSLFYFLYLLSTSSLNQSRTFGGRRPCATGYQLLLFFVYTVK